MNQWTRTLFVSLAGLSHAFAACGDSNNNNTTDTVVNDTVTADTTADTTTADTAVADTVTPVTNACTNETDLARITDSTKQAPDSVAAACATGPCLSQSLAGDVACSADCMENGNADANIEAAVLSSDCEGCYLDAILCAIQHCAGVCIDSGSQACADCRTTNNCTSNFYSCSGLTPPAQ